MLMITSFMVIFFSFQSKTEREINIKRKIQADIVLKSEIAKIYADSVFLEKKIIVNDDWLVTAKVDKVMNINLDRIEITVTDVKGKLIASKKVLYYSRNKK